MTLICYFQHNKWNMHQLHGDEVNTNNSFY